MLLIIPTPLPSPNQNPNPQTSQTQAQHNRNQNKLSFSSLRWTIEPIPDPFLFLFKLAEPTRVSRAEAEEFYPDASEEEQCA